jgi:hypothetical protein
MHAHRLLSAAIAGALGTVAVCGWAHRASAQTQSGDAKIAKTDPCTLVTKAEIQTAIEAKHKPSELASLKQKGIAWSISTKSISEGESRVCQIHWQGTMGGAMHETGDMSVRLSNAEYFTANVKDMNRVRKRTGRPDLALIPGIGDEAYFFGYSEKGNPEARVGNVAVGIEFLAGPPSVDLLRAAVGRVH